MIKGLFKSAVDLIYPTNCLICKKDLSQTKTNPICEDCLGRIERNLPPFCLKCGGSLKEAEIEKGICFSCQKRNFHFKQAWSATLYKGMMEELIHLFKYRNKPQLAKPLSQMMINFIENYNLTLKGFDMLVAVPLHSCKLREREYNQSQLLAQHLSTQMRIPLSEGNLLRQRFTPPQSSLSPEKRWNNINGAFTIKDPVQFKGKKVLIIDDLLTTGATCNEIARLLRESGANNVYALTLSIAQ